jgi:GH25 family lysozyme M1 (1,4-beta-N-acetylmuramidase)
MNEFTIKEPFVVDVSSWEDKQDWSKISPRPFAAIARATYSNYLIDSSLAHNWAEWREHGIRKTAYGFPIPVFGADDQAKLFVKAMKGVGGWDEGDLPPVLDFEQAGFTAHQIKVWLDRIDGEFGVKPIIYTRADIWETICNEFAPEWTSNYPLWVGWYPYTNYIDANSTVPENRMPKGWDKWALWQYSEAGKLEFDPYNGYDFNVMSGWYKTEILDTTIDPPSIEIPSDLKQYTLVGDGEKVIFNRTPDDNENDKIQLNYWLSSQQSISVGEIPKYRKHYKGDVDGEPTYNLVKNYETDADFLNLSLVWGFVPIQPIRKDNGNFRMLHTAWSSDENWDMNGCYVKLSQLEKISLPETYTGKVKSWSGVNIRKGAGIEHDKFAAIWYGKDVTFDKLVTENGNRWGRLKDAWCSIEHNGTSLIEMNEETELPPNESDQDDRRADWKPDPNRPDKLYVSRHTGYYKVPVFDKIGGTEIVDAPQSAIFIGDELLGGRWLRLVEMNLKPQTGWIDVEAKDMICDRIPEKTLNSLIPPAEGKVEIARTITVPSEGDFVYLPHYDTKDYKYAVPATQMLWKDNQQRPAWMRTRPDYHWLMFDLLKLKNPGLSIIRYVSMYAYLFADNRYRTDSRKDGEFFDDLHDAVLGKNKGKPCWLMKVAIRCQGNILKVLDDNESGILLDGLDMSDESIPAPAAEDIVDKPWLVGYFTQQDDETLPDKFQKVIHAPVARNEDGDETGTIEIQIKVPFRVRMGEVNLVKTENEQTVKIVNLSRDYN